jgi:hypothetical protein
MAQPTLLAGAILDLVSTLLYFYAARLVLRTLPRDHDHSTEAFALFWYGVGLVNLLQAILEGIALVQDPGLALALAFWNTRIALALVSFAGLVYYLLYVYTGRAGLRGPVILLYTIAFLLMQAWIGLAQPVGATVEGWRVGLAFVHEPRGLLYTSVVVLFFVPPLLAALAYAYIMRFTRSPAQARRVRLVSLSLFVYFAGLTLGYLNSTWYWWGLVENLLGIGAAAGVILALWPTPRAESPEAVA